MIPCFFVFLEGVAMAKGNAVRTAEGIEVYENNILILCDQFVSDLENKDYIYKTPIFKKMLKYIYKSMFKPDRNNINYINYNNKNSNLDYSNIDLLNNLWDIYTDLCYTYLQIPSLLNFSLFTGISMDAFNDWKNNNSRGDTEGASSSHCQSVKKWLKECESALADGATTGNPGPMFLLKANYGYTEQPQQIIVSGAGIPQQTAAEIADKYAAATRPELPDLE